MKQPLNDISARELKERISKGEKVRIIDVREKIEFYTFNIGGINLPLGDLGRQLEHLGYQKEEEIVVICQRGLRSETARGIMAASGFTNVKNLAGGLLAYRKIDQ